MSGNKKSREKNTIEDLETFVPNSTTFLCVDCCRQSRFLSESILSSGSVFCPAPTFSH